MARYRRTIRLCGAVLGTAALLPLSGVAEHPIDIQRLAARGDYYEALLAYERIPKRVMTSDAVLAAAKSAWALSLPDRAIEEYEHLLAQPGLPITERARIELSRGIIELQEGRPQVAVVYAERAVNRLADPSELRSRIWLLWAESLAAVKSLDMAEDRYTKALEEAAPESRAEIYFLRGQCRMMLGKDFDAVSDLKEVPLHNDRTGASLRYLAQIEYKLNNIQESAFWLETGRKDYPEDFLDSWVDYVLLTNAADEGSILKVRSIREEANKKYPPSDYWISLMEARAEALEWSVRTRMKEGQDAR